MFWACFFLIEHFYRHGDIGGRTVVRKGVAALYLVYYVETFLYFAKHGVLAIKVWCATQRGIGFGLFGAETHGVSLANVLRLLHQSVLHLLQASTVAVTTHIHNLVFVIGNEVVEGDGYLVLLHLLLHLLELRGLIYVAPNNVKLATTRLAVGVYLVAQTGGTQGATLVKEGGLYLSSDGIVGATSAQHLASGCLTAVGVATLYHEVGYHTVKQCAIIVAFFGQLDKIVAMKGCFVIQANSDVAQCSVYSYFCCHYFLLVNELTS